MDQTTPDVGLGSELGDARVEEDRLRPITRHGTPRLNRGSLGRWPAGLGFGVIGILLVSGVAFGAQVFPLGKGTNDATPAPDVAGVVNPHPGATAIVVGDDPTSRPTTPATTVERTARPSYPPTATPTDAPTATPTHGSTATPTHGSTVTPSYHPTPSPVTGPTAPYLSFAARMDGGRVRLDWAVYGGSDFGAYKIFRTTDASLDWPVGSSDTWVASVTDRNQVTTWDSPPAGTTYTYRVFAVKVTTAGYIVLIASQTQAVSVPAAPTPSFEVANLGTLAATSNGDGTYTFGWTAYTGTTAIGAYVVCWSSTTSGAFGYVEGSGNVHSADKAGSTWTGTLAPGTWRVKVEALYWPPAGRAVKVGESQIMVLVVPGSPSQPPVPTPTPAATPTPVVTPPASAPAESPVS